MRYIFGHHQNQPLPLRNKTNFDPYKAQYILCVKNISKWPLSDRHRSVTAQIFNSSDRLPDVRVYHKDTEITQYVKGQSVEDILDEEFISEVNEFDEVFLLQC